MRIYAKLGGSYESFALKKISGSEESADIILFGMGVFDEFNYESELAGKTFLAREATAVSKKHNALVCAHVNSMFAGSRHQSVLIAADGAFLGVSDALFNSSRKQGLQPDEAPAYKAGATLNIYETSLGRVAVAVGCDGDIAEIFTLARLYGAELAITMSDVPCNKISAAVRTYCAHALNLPIISVFKNQIKIFLTNGRTKSRNSSGVLSIQIPAANPASEKVFCPDLYKSIYTKITM